MTRLMTSSSLIFTINLHQLRIGQLLGAFGYSGNHAAPPQTTPESGNLGPRKEVKSLPVSCCGCARRRAHPAGPAPHRPARAHAHRPGNPRAPRNRRMGDRKSTRLNSSHDQISYAVFCLKKKKKKERRFEEVEQRD